MKNLIIAIFVSISPTLLWANSSWTCQNTINEYRCKGNECKASSPISTNFKVDIASNQKVFVCTTHKCWSGQAKKNAQNYELYEINKFGWTVQHASNTNYLLGVNQGNQSLYLQNGNQKLPLQCKLV